MLNTGTYNRERIRALEKIAFPDEQGLLFQSAPDPYGPEPTVSDVLNAIGQAQTHGIGTQRQRIDAFGRVIDTGETVSSPAKSVMGAVGGGILGNFVSGLLTKNPFMKGLGTGVGAIMGSKI